VVFFFRIFDLHSVVLISFWLAPKTARITMDETLSFQSFFPNPATCFLLSVGGSLFLALRKSEIGIRPHPLFQRSPVPKLLPKSSEALRSSSHLHTASFRFSKLFVSHQFFFAGGAPSRTRILSTRFCFYRCCFWFSAFPLASSGAP